MSIIPDWLTAIATCIIAFAAMYGLFWIPFKKIDAKIDRMIQRMEDASN